MAARISIRDARVVAMLPDRLCRVELVLDAVPDQRWRWVFNELVPTGLPPVTFGDEGLAFVDVESSAGPIVAIINRIKTVIDLVNETVARGAKEQGSFPARGR